MTLPDKIRKMATTGEQFHVWMALADWIESVDRKTSVYKEAPKEERCRWSDGNEPCRLHAHPTECKIFGAFCNTRGCHEFVGSRAELSAKMETAGSVREGACKSTIEAGDPYGTRCATAMERQRYPRK